MPFQGLRAVAFSGIFLSHTGIEEFSSLGPWGVSVFFILSGFLMMVNYYSTDKLKKITVKDNLCFSISKVRKLYPLHIVMMLVALMLTMHSAKIINVKWLLKLLLQIGANITLLQSFFPHSVVYYSLNAVAWYLSVCLFIYFCFPWILSFCKKHTGLDKTADCRMALKGILILFTLQMMVDFLASFINLPLSDGFTKWFVYVCPLTRLIDFIIGCFVGLLYLKSEEQRNKNNGLLGVFAVALIIVACSIFTLVNPAESDVMHSELWWRLTTIFTLPNVALIYNLARRDGIIAKVLSVDVIVGIGNISAYAFLIHQIVIRCINILFSKIEVEQIGLKIMIPFVLTMVSCLIWKRIINYFRMRKKGLE